MTIETINNLPPTARALIVLGSSKTERDLRELVCQAQTITDIADQTGREQAHRMGMTLKKARTTIEKTGKAARDDATSFCKAVITEEKRLIAITEGEEKRVLGLRDAFDEKLEAERRAAEARRAEIQSKIDGIRRLPLDLAGASSDEIAAEKAALESFLPTSDVFGDLTGACEEALSEAIAGLGDLHARTMAKEAALAAQEAERRRIEEELAAERAAIEAERAKLAAERAKLAAERAKLEALRAAVAASTGAESAPAEPAAEPEPEKVEPVVELVASPDVPATDWRTRQFAMHTARQFEALAAKVNQCGFAAFAGDLRLVAEALLTGAHDAAMAKADREALVAADNLLLDATMDALDAITDEQAAA